ncbi:MAG TPA: T9SS type A sorting domain-containing protein [Candidatus Kapabacteria bacterium]
MIRYSLILVVLLALIFPNLVSAQQERSKGEEQVLMSSTVQWDRYIDSVIGDVNSPVIRHVILFNPKPNDPTLIKRVYLTGKDAAEFSILNTEAPSLSNFILQSGDSDWFDIAFTPDPLKPKHAVREAQLVSICDYFGSDSIDVIYFRGILQTQSVKYDLPLEDILLTPNPLTGDIVNVLFTSLEEKKLSFAVYDMLGREVAVMREKVYFAGKNSLPIAIGDVAAGVYILRVSDGVLTKSISFRVVR